MKNVNEVPKTTDTLGGPKTKRETEQYDPYKKGKSISDVKFSQAFECKAKGIMGSPLRDRLPNTDNSSGPKPNDK